jgi:type II secretion system protein E
MEVDRNPRQPLIGRSVDVIVNIIRTTENGKTVRKVNKIIKVNGFNKKTKEYEIEEVG